jgi:hypothetical protein
MLFESMLRLPHRPSDASCSRSSGPLWTNDLIARIDLTRSNKTIIGNAVYILQCGYLDGVPVLALPPGAAKDHVIVAIGQDFRLNDKLNITFRTEHQNNLSAPNSGHRHSNTIPAPRR